MITATDLRLTFGEGTPLENPALRGMSLTVNQGEFVTVIGSNGAGKSTFLNALAGEVLVDSGKILVDNIDVTKLPTHKRTGRVARVFQDPLAGTCEGLSIEENLALAIKRGKHRSLGTAVKRQYREHFRASLATLGLGLENRLTDKMGLLSGGQRQAVSLLMASLTPSSILLLDEHTAALDPKTASFVLELTQNIIAEQKLTALMVTHSMKQALEVGTRTVMLHQGEVVFDIAGKDREGLQVKDLLNLFEQQRGLTVDDDSLLLS
ncbi:ABC transporter ATP-binding protein [Marinobacter psychrophilus]|jgi:putative ABC transport system ATP-binding protein|uniref:ABC transporter ATP-binding protein n=1 Tax=Marinobacter psychrophilus TaxID=330734 RepID=UPI001B7C0070|nr:ABC transporter ATP-binding protein [Marinobacter psychrophilus]MBQ0761862.1 ABC transporter ATP-binding protein [Marinobacter psychrophilus]MBQ0845252.1 ABC transporter ATP-binding protein [Marinobacter psychrophilus]